MSLFNRRDAYGRVSIALHWLFALLLLAQAGTALFARFSLDGNWRLDVFEMHLQIGAALSGLAAFAVAWRIVNANVHNLMEQNFAGALFNIARQLAYYGLYFSVIAQGALGVMMLQLAGKPAEVFGWSPPLLSDMGGGGVLPGVAAWFGDTATTAIKQIRIVHAFIANGVLLLVAAHLLDILYRRYIFGHPVLRRMFSAFPEERRKLRIDRRKMAGAKHDGQPRDAGRRWEDLHPPDAPPPPPPSDIPAEDMPPLPVEESSTESESSKSESAPSESSPESESAPSESVSESESSKSESEPKSAPPQAAADKPKFNMSAFDKKEESLPPPLPPKPPSPKPKFDMSAFERATDKPSDDSAPKA